MNERAILEAEIVASELRDRCPEYLAIRVLPDATIIALGDLLYTRAIFIDLNLQGYAQRYCFEDRLLASTEFWKLDSGDQVPHGFIARRPE